MSRAKDRALVLEVRRRLVAGETAPQIAAELDVATRTIWEWNRRYGWVTLKQGGNRYLAKKTPRWRCWGCSRVNETGKCPCGNVPQWAA